MDKIRQFSVTTYGNLEKYTETISKARCRIFYKGLNRNGSFITDEFADKLLASIPYAPVKGIYNTDDYEDHGKRSDEGRIYGIVPENPNLAWEDFEDEDGVVRTYACVDVYVFTALYEEAQEVIGKAQSMEIYPPSIRGEWTYMKGRRVFKFTDGCFLGLQVLGDEVEPCFEGAAFFALYDNIVAAFQKIEDAAKDTKNTNEMGGQSEMNFKISYSQVEQALWSLLNTSFTEEGEWTVSHAVCELYDDYALVRNFEAGTYERVYYSKNEETEEISITKTETCRIVDVTESEYTTLKAVQAINNSFEALDTKLNELEDIKAEVETVKADYATAQETISANEQKIGELEENISTLTTERDTFSAQATEAGEVITNLQSQVDALNEYKLDIEKKEKEAIILKYSEQLPEDVIADYTARIAEFAAIDLDKELAYALVNTNPSVFSADPNNGLVPKNQPKSGIEALLEQYRNKNNK